MPLSLELKFDHRCRDGRVPRATSKSWLVTSLSLKDKSLSAEMARWEQRMGEGLGPCCMACIPCVTIDEFCVDVIRFVKCCALKKVSEVLRSQHSRLAETPGRTRAYAGALGLNATNPYVFLRAILQ